ncbi:DUF6350 family protein [Leucobacter luti]|uniref:cell division protein PerM n=1 Tax=Leucobacter luti TaxID=340320 RepID=UPI001C68D5AA|nr:DUF6350 family protein [Leucobacter luti]QYM76739.1 hypothetical protein K1X41_04860 [Leucobacter luti]
MRSLVTAVIAAIEAVAVAAVGFASIVVPALLLWAVTFTLAAEPSTVFSGVAATWSLAHFAPLTLALTPEDALSFGLAPTAVSFGLTLAPLGITLITASLALRSGWRLGTRGGVGGAGLLGGAAGFGVSAAVIAGFAQPFLVWPVTGVIAVAVLVYAVPATCGFLLRAAREEHPWWRAMVRQIQRGVEALGLSGAAALPARAAETLRLGGAAIAGLLLLAGIAVAVALLTGYGQVIALTQHLQLDPLGSLLLFLAQLALLPVAVLWGMSWLTGAGFSVGAGTAVTPFETLLGPVPALPIFGAIPQGWGAAGAIVPAIVVLTGIALVILLGRNSELRRVSWPVALAIPALAAVIAGLVVTGLAALSTGAIGPDRLALTGPEPWLVGGLVMAELGAGLLLGTVALRIDASRVRAVLPDGLPESLRSFGAAGGAGAAAAAAASATETAAAAPSSSSADDHETVPLADVLIPFEEEWGRPDEITASEIAAAELAAAESAPAELAEVQTGTHDVESAEFGTSALDTAEFTAEALDPDATQPFEFPGPAEPAPRSTQLFDQHEAELVEGALAEAEYAETEQLDSDTLDDSEEVDEASATEALRAYSWDDSVDPDPDPEPKAERPGWRLPRPWR